MELHTDRLRLRPFRKNDLADVHSYASDPDVVKYMTFGPNTKKDTKDFLSRTIEANKKLPRLQYDFALERRDSGKLIGACGLYLRGPLEAEVGWTLNKDYWNNGYMTEAAKALIEFGFSTLKFHRIYSSCFSENHGSYRVMEKCGMRREAHFLKNRRLRSNPEGDWYDEYVYAILFDEWKNQNE